MSRASQEQAPQVSQESSRQRHIATSASTRARRQDGWLASTTVIRPLTLGLAKILLLPIVSAAPLHLYSNGGIFTFDEGGDGDVPKIPRSPQDPRLWLYLAIAVILVLLGGIFAGLTIALMGQDETNLSVLVQSGEGSEQKNAQAVLDLLKRGKHWVLVALLLSNVVTNETLPIVLDRSLGGGWPAVVCSTILIVIFGEVVPQSVCVRYGLSIGAYMATPVFWLMLITGPVAWPTAKLLDYALGEEHGITYKKAGLKALIGMHRTLGRSPEDRLAEDEANIITSVLELKEKAVSEVMTPMEDVFTMSADTVLDEKMMDTILAQGYSRIPIHMPDNDHNFIGMLLVKILITYDPEDCKRVRDFALATLPETSPTTSCLDIINFFQEGKSHMVLVSEDPGTDHGAIGVVTLEDVIEELIGEEIVDESDVFIDVHKAIRRITPADTRRYRMTRNNRLVEVDTNYMSESEREVDKGGIDDGQHLENPESRKPSVANGGQQVMTNPHSTQVPGTTFMMRRKSSNASDSTHDTVKPIPMRSNTQDLRQHLAHLGPSNVASRPRETKYKNVKIKPGVGTIPEDQATTLPLDSGRSRSIDAAVNAESAPLLGGRSASGGVRALNVGHYGTTEGNIVNRVRAQMDSSDRISANEASRFAGENTGPTKSASDSSHPATLAAKNNPDTLRVPDKTVIRGIDRRASAADDADIDDNDDDGDRDEEDGDTVGEMKAPSRNHSKTRRTARSGSITETTVDVGGVKKVVLETTSSSDEPENGGASSSRSAAEEEDAGKGNSGVNGGKKKRQKKRGKRKNDGVRNEAL